MSYGSGGRGGDGGGGGGNPGRSYDGGRGGYGGGSGGRGPTETNILKLKGLPFQAGEREVFDFFHGFNILGAYILMDMDGKPSGMAFAEFENEDDARMACVKRDRAYMGNRFVKCLRVPRAEMEQQLGATGMIPPPAPERRAP
eukprot:CAMPEP_0198215700 /NCGR_PEP_ID=MMETSP1445-20131203/51907_1 /TAXON_ID=36898 /ORGANISM="Pyramimonas sp., Strain CCMP2087" /LENGTH=142 /DNA_ID=CAMNT_0043891531 /DNA_START=227 /DNA_END=651 /DNA_ORIENTATION=-